MKENNLLEKLVRSAPVWRSGGIPHPVIFENWCRKLLGKARRGNSETLKRQFGRMYNKENPEAVAFSRRHDQPLPLSPGHPG